jgi:predicted membrane channel-forming protein YqfA (hemolysin III family)
VRFALIGWAAVRFGDGILQIASSPQFTWVMAGFAVLYVIGSILSLFRWFRKSKSAAA